MIHRFERSISVLGHSLRTFKNYALHVATIALHFGKLPTDLGDFDSRYSQKSVQWVVEYLGRYTHKIAISNHRLMDLNEQSVTFAYKDYRAKGLKKYMQLSHSEFVRRLALHILPRRFVKIRHYGFLSSTWKREKLGKLIRTLVAQDAFLPQKQSIKQQDANPASNIFTSSNDKSIRQAATKRFRSTQSSLLVLRTRRTLSY